MSTNRLSPKSKAPAVSDERGFALVMVVLLLFAIAVAGATGYQVVSTEFFQSQQSTETGQALVVAEAGLQWFIGGQRGFVPDTTEYSMNGGTAVVTTRRVATISDEEDLYLVTSEGTYTDPRYPQIPAVRIASQYAIYKKIPMNSVASFVTTARRVDIDNNGRVYGTDVAGVGTCPSATGATIGGVMARNQVREEDSWNIDGGPDDVTPGSFAAVVDTIGLAWDIYSDTDYPVDFDNSWPGSAWFASNPDSFPVIRMNGNFSPTWSRNGRGVLIITGELRIRNWAFWTWQGIVLADDIQDNGSRDYFTIYGMLVAGQGSQMRNNYTMDRGTIYYHSCNVADAGAALAHMEPLTNGWWEER